MSWSTSESRVRLALLNRFKPSSKIFYWPLQGGTVTSFVDLLCFFLSCVCYDFVRVCFYVLCGHLLGKGWPLDYRLWCHTVNLSLSHWYPGSGVVLDYIDSWSLHSYFLLFSEATSDSRNSSYLSICVSKCSKTKMVFNYAPECKRVFSNSIYCRNYARRQYEQFPRCRASFGGM